MALPMPAVLATLTVPKPGQALLAVTVKLALSLNLVMTATRMLAVVAMRIAPGLVQERPAAMVITVPN